MDREDRLMAYIQNKLPTEDAQSFEAELAADETLAAEVAALRAVRAEFGEQDKAEDVQAGWARFEEALDEVAPQPANRNRPVKLSLLQVAAVVVASLLLWQFAVVPNLSETVGTGYETVSEEPAGPILQVIFQSDASIGAISELLGEYDGTILDGPSAMGLYRIEFPDMERRDAARAAFAERPGLAVSATLE